MFHMRRRVGHLALVLALGGMVACQPSSPQLAKPIDFDSHGFEGFENTTFDIVAAACTFDVSGNMTLTVGANETVYVFKRATDGLVVANAQTAGGVECTVATTKKIYINSYDLNAVDNQKVIIDYYGGLFAMATAASTFPATNNAFIQIDLGAGAGDQVKVRGTANADSITFGTTSAVSYAGVAMGANATTAPAARTMQDVSIKGVEDIVVSTGPGTDVISALGIGGTAVLATTPNALLGTIAFTAYGGDGSDILTSGALSSGGASNSLYGNAGNDKFLQQVALAKDMLDGGDDTDVVDYSSRTPALTVTLGYGTPAAAATGTLTTPAKASILNNESFSLDDGPQTKTFEYRSVNDIAATGNITFVDYTLIDNNDTFTLDDGPNPAVAFEYQVDGTFVATGGGVVVIDIQGAANVAAVVTATINAINAATLAITPAAGTGVVNLTNDATGTAGNVAITSTFAAGALAATVAGMSGGTTWTPAGGGVDVIDIRTLTTAAQVAYATAQAINAVAGTLTITATLPAVATITLTNDGTGVAGNTTSAETVVNAGFVLTDMTGGSAAVPAATNDGESAEQDDILATVENVVAGAGNDSINASYATGVAHILVGGAGNDTLLGADLADTLYGGQGNDTIKGGGGVDTIKGGDGDDDLQGGVGDDAMDGGGINCPTSGTVIATCVAASAANIGLNTLNFADRITGEDVTCDLSTPSGALVVCGVAGEHDQWVAASFRNLIGGAGNDVLTGDANANTIWGGAGGDTIKGMAGNDTLYGESGDDTVYGGNNDANPSGNDFISGGTGADSLLGEDGNDFIDADDGMVDTAINCGAQDADVGVSDATDPATVGCAL